MLNKKIEYIFILMLVLFGQIFLGFAQTTYNIDTEKSHVNFKIKHMGFLTVNGMFKDFSGELVFNKDKLVNIKSNIEVEGINTNDKTRDESLIDEAYLNAKKYPFINFTSTKIINNKKKNILKGVLTIKETRKELQIPFNQVIFENIKIALLKIKTVLNRKNFNLDFGAMDVLVGDIIEVDISIRAFVIK